MSRENLNRTSALSLNMSGKPPLNKDNVLSTKSINGKKDNMFN